MEYVLIPDNSINSQCLLIVGGSGDSVKKFKPIAEEFSNKLPTYTICSMSLPQTSTTNSLLQDQSNELMGLVEMQYNKFEYFDIFATSMGVYPTINVLLNNSLSEKIRTIVLFDPADYEIDLHISNTNGEITWSGYQDYKPRNPTISTKLKAYRGNAKIHVVHLVIRNYSPKGYIESDFSKRGIDNTSGHTRISTEMVKAFYDSTPSVNRGVYIEVNNLPHGFIRDGNIRQNIKELVCITSDLLLSK